MEISGTIDVLGRKRPKGRPSGSILKSRFNKFKWPYSVITQPHMKSNKLRMLGRYQSGQ